jgi:hypothetical protein
MKVLCIDETEDTSFENLQLHTFLSMIGTNIFESDSNTEQMLQLFAFFASKGANNHIFKIILIQNVPSFHCSFVSPD